MTTSVQSLKRVWIGGGGGGGGGGVCVCVWGGVDSGIHCSLKI